MNVALIYPEVYDLARFREKRKEFPPFGVLYLAAVMEGARHSVTVFKVSPGFETLNLSKFEAVAFSIPSSATFGVVKQSRFTSTINPAALIIAGGVHVNFFPEQSLIDLKVDAVGIGDGEKTILELLERGKSQNYSDIPGTMSLVKGEPRRSPPRPDFGDLDLLPLPARHLLSPDDMIMEDRLAGTDIRMAHIMFSRGCPFPCRFCAAASSRIYYRSGASARVELSHMKDVYGIGGFAVVDDNFVVNKHKVADICGCISDLNLQWSALSRVDTVDEKLLAEMHRAGCIEIKFGLESGSQRILAAMDKRITPDEIHRALQASNKVGITNKVFIIHGFPGENAESTKETIQLLENLKPLISRVALFRFVPLPGTYVYKHPEQFSLHGTDRDSGWDGDWGRYHIHHNNRHWWGNADDFSEMNSSYMLLKDFIEAEWPERAKFGTQS